MKSVLVWTALLLLAYFGADIVEKGNALNSLTPWPILGWMLWGFLAAFVWIWLIWPVVQFCRLKQAGSTSLKGRAQSALRHLHTIRGHESHIDEMKVRLDTAIKQRDDAAMEKALADFSLIDNRKMEADALIMQHSKAAGVAVVFSRNNLLDGILLLVIQARLVVELARRAGYKPSPVFNTLCFSWILTNSILAALMLQDLSKDAGEALTVVISEMLSAPEELTADAVGTKMCSFTIGTLLEALAAGSTVYVTGHLFLRKLNIEQPINTQDRLRDLVSLRQEARKEIGCELLKALPGIAKTAISKAGKFLSSTALSFLPFGNSDSEETKEQSPEQDTTGAG